MGIVNLLNRSVSLAVAVSMLASCAGPKGADRLPASSSKHLEHEHHSHNSFLEDLSPLTDKEVIHKYKGMMKAPPMRFLAAKALKGGLKIFLKNFPLDETVHDRYVKGLQSEKFASLVIPFLFAMKSAYLADGKNRKNNFRKHILKEFPDKNEIPGLDHDHFRYDEAKKEEEKKKDDSMKKKIASALTIFDIIFLRDGTFVLGKPPVRNLAIISNLKVEIKNMLQIIRDGATDPIMTEIYDNLIKDNDRIEAMSVSIIDFAGMFTFSHYQMFAKRYAYEEAMKNKLQAQFKDGLGDELWSSINDELYNRRYGVQVIVDGLQGHLLEALVSGDSKHPFIQNVVDEHKNQERYKPKNIPYHLGTNSELNFLEAVATGEVKTQEINYLPFFKSLYKNHQNGIVKNGISTSPTVSVRNLPIIQTGGVVIGKNGGTGIPTFHYLEREQEQAYYFWGNDALMLDDITKNAGMKNLFQRMPDKFHLNCAATYETGANWSISPILNVAIGEKMRDFGEVICLQELEDRVDIEKKIRKLKLELLSVGQKIKERRFAEKDERRMQIHKAQKIIDEIADHGSDGMPELLVMYVPWPDHFGHFTGPFGDQILSPTGELNRLDYWLGRVSQAYKDANIYDRTMFSMSGDHGLTPTRYLIKAEKQIFDGMQKEGINIRQWKISSDEGEGPKIRNHLNKEKVRGYDVMTASTGGGNFQIELFVDQGENWKRQPVFEEAKAIKLIGGNVVDIPTEIVNRLEDTLEYGAIRETKSDYKNSATRIFAQRDGKRIDEVIYRRGNKIFYKSNYNLLGTNSFSKWDYAPNNLEKANHKVLHQKCMDEAQFSDVSSWCDEKEWRQLTSYTNKPDSVVQLSHLFDIEYSGTIHLFSNPYVGFNSIVPGRHAGELFHEKDAFLAVWGTPVKLSQKIRSRQITSSAPTLYEYLSGKKAIAGEDGWGDESLLNDNNK